jgi:hypothetical protein
MTDFLPPRAPDGDEPARWEPRPPEGDGHARVVVATTSDAPTLVQTGEHPPRNGQAIASLGIGIAGVALLVLSVGISFLVTLPCEIIAVVLGRHGRRRAAAEGIGGTRAARAGMIVGWVGIALCVIAAIVWIAIIVSDVDVNTDFGRDSPSAPTDLSAIVALLRGHL